MKVKVKHTKYEPANTSASCTAVYCRQCKFVSKWSAICERENRGVHFVSISVPAYSYCTAKARVYWRLTMKKKAVLNWHATNTLIFLCTPCSVNVYNAAWTLLTSDQKILPSTEGSQLLKMLTTLENAHNRWKCSQPVKMLTTLDNVHNARKCSQR